MWPFRNRNTKELEDSGQAIVSAQKELRRVKSRTDEVHQISVSLKTIRERNHFSEQLRVIIERR